MHIDIVPNRNSKPAILLRESYRDGKIVRKRTLANLSALPMEQIQAIRLILKGEKLAPAEELFEVIDSPHHGHVHAVLTAMKRLGFANLLAARRSRERDLIMAMVAARVLEPKSKLATTDWWSTTTLPEILEVEDADEDDLYDAMDWLFERQDGIEKKLAARHLESGGLVLYDLSSSYFEGEHCPLAKRGYSRDGKRGTLQVNYGLLTDKRGCPVAVSVYEGSTGDAKTLLPAATKCREDFKLDSVVIVGDRGMIGKKQIEELHDAEGMDWVTALKSSSIKKLMEAGDLQMGLFDERNFFELTSPTFPGERLVACRNTELAKRRAHKRQSLLAATIREIEQVQGMVSRKRLQGKGEIGVRIGRVINKYKVAKHFKLEIEDGQLDFSIRQENVDAEAALDGLYVIRTSLPEEKLSCDDVVRTYKRLTQVERAFRSFKTIDLKVRPIHHRLESRVRTHIFLCMLAYYVQWHITEAWRSLLFSDEDQAAKMTRDPVAPAKRSKAAERKASTKHREDGTRVTSFRVLLAKLGTIVRNRCRRPGADSGEPSFTVETTPSPEHQAAYNLLADIHV
jgi:transposase